MLSTLLVILLVLILLGALPTTGWHSYGYGPSGLVGVVLVVLLVGMLLRGGL